MLILHNYYDDGATLQINDLTIGEGSTLRAKGFRNSFNGSLHVYGALLVDPSGGSGYANMTIYGTLFSTPLFANLTPPFFCLFFLQVF
jgi:hypothetical protein